MKYIKGWGNLSFGSLKRPRGLTDEFYGFIKSRKRSNFVIDSCFVVVFRSFPQNFLLGVPDIVLGMTNVFLYSSTSSPGLFS